ncbi:hypothetical protein PFISCL1PPCAC_10689, partial [Pristionchus fissidentatus]
LSIHFSMRLLILFFSLLHLSLQCLLCPLNMPPRPRPLDQFKIPTIPKFNTESMPKFCNLTEVLPVGDVCKEGISRILCSADDLIDVYSNGCPGPEDQQQCSACERSKPANMWVVRWFDSLGKMPHGVSEGNYYWLGDYEICHDIQRERHFNGQYCLVRLEVPDSLVEAGCPQTDPLEIIYGICAPLECKEHELEAIAKAYAPYKVRVECEVDREAPWSHTIVWSLIAVWKIFLITLTILSTKSFAPAWFMKFNIKVNGNKCLSTRRSDRSHERHLDAIHGLMLVTYIFIMLGYVYNLMLPYIENVAFAFDNVPYVVSHLTNNYSYHVDGLLALLCFYSASMMYGNVDSLLKVLLVTINSILRFWPTYAFLITYVLFLLPHNTAGPMWIHGAWTDRCSVSWWKNLLFINNYFGARDTCLDFGYAISLFIHYYAIVAFLCWLARDHFRFTFAIAGCGILASIIYSFVIIYTRNLPPAPIITAEPINVEKMEELLNLIIISPLARLSPALIGFLFALLPHTNIPENFIFFRYEKIFRFLLFVLFIVFSLFVGFYLVNFASGANVHPLLLAFYGAVHRPIWAISLMILGYLITHAHGFEVIEIVLGWRFLAPLAKRILPAILISELIIVSSFSSLHRPSYATHWSLVYRVIFASLISLKLALACDTFISRPLRNILIADYNADGKTEEEEDGMEMEERHDSA